MSEPILTAEEILAWNETTAQRLATSSSPITQILLIPCDIAGTKYRSRTPPAHRRRRSSATPNASPVSPIPTTTLSRSTPWTPSTPPTTAPSAIFQQLIAADSDWDETHRLHHPHLRLRSAPPAKPSSSTRSCTASVTTRSSPPLSATAASNPTSPWTTCSCTWSEPDKALPATYVHRLQSLQNVWFIRCAQIIRALPVIVTTTSYSCDGRRSP